MDYWFFDIYDIIHDCKVFLFFQDKTLSMMFWPNILSTAMAPGLRGLQPGLQPGLPARLTWRPVLDIALPEFGSAGDLIDPKSTAQSLCIRVYTYIYMYYVCVYIYTRIIHAHEYMYNVLLYFAWTRALLIWGLYPIESQVLSNSQRSCKVGDISCQIVSNPTMYPYIPRATVTWPHQLNHFNHFQVRHVRPTNPGYPGHPDITAQNGHTLPGEARRKFDEVLGESHECR